MDNKYCAKLCKHKSYCGLDQAATSLCKNSDAELDEVFGKSGGPLFGYTEDEIARKQGIKKLKK